MGSIYKQKKKASVIIATICIVLSVGILSGCVEEPKEPELKNIVETASENADFETLVTAVTAANLAGTLSNEDAQFTVFAPTDAAFAALDPTFLANLVNNDTANLTKILTYHVITGK
ncbi:MAG: fasciclin domain-containing protein, partial [Candidatus Thermoplasmatota archaeon]|nr:fasciclin domain-containing protein [Candidatus Thermoplasmatota archaeon]